MTHCWISCLAVLFIFNANSDGAALSNVLKLACSRNPTLHMCSSQQKQKDAVVAIKEDPKPESSDEELYCRKYRLTFNRFCESAEELTDEVKQQIITFCQSYDRICVLGRKGETAVESPVLKSAPQEEQPKALVVQADGTVVNCADRHCKTNVTCWKACRCARIDLLAREFCPKHRQKPSEKSEFQNICSFWKYECTPLSRRNFNLPVVEPHSHLSGRDKDRQILHDRITAAFSQRRALDLPPTPPPSSPPLSSLFDAEIPEDKKKSKAFQTKNFPLLPSDSSYGAGNFDALTDSGGVLHRTRSRSPWTKPGLWEANPDNPHNRDHANKWYYGPRSVAADWLSGQVTWGGHWAVPGAGVGGTDGFSAIHFPTVGTFLNIADDYD